MTTPIDRRDFILHAAATGAAAMAAGALALPSSAGAAAPQLLGYPASGPGPARGLDRAPTAACGGDETTRALSAGPFYTPGTPRRGDLIDPGMPGVPITITGRVVDAACLPLAGAVLDFWQADSAGEYDNEGFRLRGHQYTDGEGAYRLLTIKPGRYSSFFTFRTPHIHVVAQGPGTRPLTTQLFFSDETADNARDGLIRPSLVMAVAADGAGGLEAQFDLVLDTAWGRRPAERERRDGRNPSPRQRNISAIYNTFSPDAV